MKLIEFPEQTVVYAKDQPQYLPLPAHQVSDSLEGEIVFCWEASWRERFAILLSGKLWHSVLTFRSPLQPQLLSVKKPEMAVRGAAPDNP